MPNNGYGEGTFVPEGSETELNYRMESWVELGQYPDREHSIETSDLSNVDFLVFEVWGEDPSDVQFVTVWGPFDDWEGFEDALAYDFGEEGSL